MHIKINNPCKGMCGSQARKFHRKQLIHSIAKDPQFPNKTDNKFHDNRDKHPIISTSSN